MQAVSASFAGRPAWMRQLVKGTDRRVEVDRGEGGHEQDLAHAAAATGDHAAPPEGAAVAVDRRDPDQGGDPAPVEAAELGQLGDQGASGDRADSRGRRQQVFGSPPGGRPSDGVVEIALDPGQRLLQPQEVAVEIALQFGNPDLAAPVASAPVISTILAPAGDQLGQPLCLGVGQGPRLRPDAFGEQSDHLGIQGIGLGKTTDYPSEIPDLARIDDRQRQLGAAQRSGHGDLETAGRLEHDQGRRHLVEPRRSAAPGRA